MTWSLCFVDAGVEQGFVASQHVKLATHFSIGLFLLSVLVLTVFLLSFVQGWSTNGGVFAPSDEGKRVAAMRHLVWGGILALSMVGIVFARSRRFKAALGPRGFELLVMLLICIVAVATPLQHPWYLSKACGVSDPATIILGELRDDGLLLFMDVGLSSCHFMLAIRWKVLASLEVLVLLVYLVPAFSWRTHGSSDFFFVVVNTVFLSILVSCAAISKRALEKHERLGFTQIAVERTLRAEAEHELSRATNVQTPANNTRQLRTYPRSEVTTTSSELFNLRNNATRFEDHLSELARLGLQEHWLITKESLQLLPDNVLGMGGFGMALVGLYHGAEVVLKVARTNAVSKESLASADELRIFRRLKHPNIVGFYGACIVPDLSEIVLVLEYVRGVDLHRAIRGIARTPSEVVARCMLVDDICCALQYLHDQEPTIIHGDIKAANVLVHMVGARHRAKLLDFGLSRLLTRRAHDLGGTPRWMAPEVIRNDQSAKAPSSDVFSFGRLVYMIMTGRAPLSHLSKRDIVDAALSGVCPQLDWPAAMPLMEQTRALCEDCLQVKPASRPSIAEVQSALHRWPQSASPRGVMAALGKALHLQTHPKGDLVFHSRMPGR